jgi:hypothetical protein
MDAAIEVYAIVFSAKKGRSSIRKNIVSGLDILISKNPRAIL